MRARARHHSDIIRPLALAALSLALLLAALTPPRPAFACDCPPRPPPHEALEQADAVFQGRVVRIDDANGQWIHARIEVSQVWKGTIHELVHVRTHAHEPTCGYHFEVGRSDLVYASLDSPDRLATSLCDRTRPTSAAQEDLEALGPGNPPLPGSAVAAEGTAWLAPTVGAGATVLLIGLGAWAIRRRGRA